MLIFDKVFMYVESIRLIFNKACTCRICLSLKKFSVPYRAVSLKWESKYKFVRESRCQYGSTNPS